MECECDIHRRQMKRPHKVINSGFYLVVLVLLLCALQNISAAEHPDTMRVTLLGTGTPFPVAERFGSAILVEAAGKKLLFDGGRGAVIRLAQLRFDSSAHKQRNAASAKRQTTALRKVWPTSFLDRRRWKSFRKDPKVDTAWCAQCGLRRFA